MTSSQVKTLFFPRLFFRFQVALPGDIWASTPWLKSVSRGCRALVKAEVLLEADLAVGIEFVAQLFGNTSGSFVGAWFQVSLDSEMKGE